MEALGHLESRLDILRPLIEAEATIEVAIDACGRVWVEQAGDTHMSLSGVTLSPVEVRDLAGLIANKQRLTLTDSQPGIEPPRVYRRVEHSKDEPYVKAEIHPRLSG